MRDEAPRDEGVYVAYWMVASRRTFWNPALERAAAWSRELGKSLLVCEPLRRRPGRSHARGHRFLLDGMAANARRLAYAGVVYHPFVEADPGDSEGLLAAVARRAAVVVTDAAASTDLDDRSHLEIDGSRFQSDRPERQVRLEAVDSASVVKTSDLTTLVHEPRFRAGLLASLQEFPARNPLAKFYETQLQAVLPQVREGWPAADGMLLGGDPRELDALALGGPEPLVAARGGADAAFEVWRSVIGALSGADSDGTPLASPPERPWLREGAPPSQPQAEFARGGGATIPSGSWLGALGATADPPRVDDLLGFYLDAGHLSRFQVLVECLRHCRWTPEKLGDPADGVAWWGLPEPVAELLERLVVSREVGRS